MDERDQFCARNNAFATLSEIVQDWWGLQLLVAPPDKGTVQEAVPVNTEDGQLRGYVTLKDWGRVAELSKDDRARLHYLMEFAARKAVAGMVRSHQNSRPSRTRFPEIIGSASAMKEVFALLDKVVQSNATVLICGESGTGKELIARAIHYHGARAQKSFVVQNCSALNDNLLESALFGHVRGAFTGAVKDQKGLFEMADGGTFFLDEIGDMSPMLQVKLLRVLQEGTFTPVGSTKQVSVDVRIVAASHKNLAEMVRRREFREDLYYRIHVLQIELPPLRERVEDLPDLIAHFIQKHRHANSAPPVISPETVEWMASYSWPGNIRELENELERLSVLSLGNAEIGPELLSPRIQQAARALPPP